MMSTWYACCVVSLGRGTGVGADLSVQHIELSNEGEASRAPIPCYLRGYVR